MAAATTETTAQFNKLIEDKADLETRLEKGWNLVEGPEGTKAQLAKCTDLLARAELLKKQEHYENLFGQRLKEYEAVCDRIRELF